MNAGPQQSTTAWVMIVSLAVAPRRTRRPLLTGMFFAATQPGRTSALCGFQSCAPAAPGCRVQNSTAVTCHPSPEVCLTPWEYHIGLACLVK